MLKIIFNLLLLISLTTNCLAQTNRVQQALQKAFKSFLDDEQLQGASVGFLVRDKSGKVVFEHQPQTLMSPASTQKILTSMAAFEKLGSNFKFSTPIYFRKLNDTQIDVYLMASADPSFGSFRFDGTKMDNVINYILSVIPSAFKVNRFFINIAATGPQPLPEGWIWSDIGNYYGAGLYALNWNENQFDVHLVPGNKIGDTVKISKLEPNISVQLNSFVTTEAKGTGDQAYIFLAPYSKSGFITGTVPIAPSFIITGAMPNPTEVFINQLKNVFEKRLGYEPSFQINNHFQQQDWKLLTTIVSPSLDSLNYYFLQKSINLYGEAFAYAVAKQKKLNATLKDGAEAIQDFLKQKKIATEPIEILDGSGLSPQNSISANTLVNALLYAQKQPWFSSFYKALPLYNQMKLKSGTIHQVKAFAGYHGDYTIAFIVNRFNGSTATLVQKMYRVLNCLR